MKKWHFVGAQMCHNTRQESNKIETTKLARWVAVGGG